MLCFYLIKNVVTLILSFNVMILQYSIVGFTLKRKKKRKYECDRNLSTRGSCRIKNLG